MSRSKRAQEQVADERPARSRVARWAPLLLVVATAAAWSNSLDGPFVFDDLPSIVDNPQIRGADALWRVFEDPGRGDFGVSGRPVAAWTLALNYALGGLDPRGYHLLNVAIHIAAGLALFALVRLAVGARRAGEPLARHADLFATCSAALFLLHPLQTKSVTFVIQRLESLAGLFFLLTLYAVARAATDSRRKRAWSALAVASCALGMGTKESMASAPIAALLLDRALFAGSFAAAWRERKALHASLFATWVVLAALVIGHPRLAVAGEAASSLGVLEYLQIQAGAIVRYLALWLFPRELVFDYGMHPDGVPPPANWLAWAPQGLLVLGMLVFFFHALARNRIVGFLGVASFLVLAPSSTLVPIRLDPIAEHRMYLPVAALSIGAVAAVWSAAKRWAPAKSPSAAASVCAVLALACATRTYARNADYHSDLDLWGVTARQRPGSARAATNYGVALASAGRLDEAIEQHRAALAARPDYSEAHHNLANALMLTARVDEAEASYRAALAAAPGAYESHLGLGECLQRASRFDEAATEFEAAIAARPGLYGAHRSLALIRTHQQRLDDAVRHFDAALALDGSDAELWNFYGKVCAQRGDFERAGAHFRTALRLRPDFSEARANLERLEAASR